MARVIPFFRNAAVMSPATLQFGIVGLVAAAAGLAWSELLRVAQLAWI